MSSGLFSIPLLTISTLLSDFNNLSSYYHYNSVIAKKSILPVDTLTVIIYLEDINFKPHFKKRVDRLQLNLAS